MLPLSVPRIDRTETSSIQSSTVVSSSSPPLDPFDASSFLSSPLSERHLIFRQDDVSIENDSSASIASFEYPSLLDNPRRSRRLDFLYLPETRRFSSHTRRSLQRCLPPTSDGRSPSRGAPPIAREEARRYAIRPHDTRCRCQLGTPGLSVAIDLRSGLLCRRDDAPFSTPLRSRQTGDYFPSLSPTIRCDDCGRNVDQQDGTGFATSLRSDARAEMGGQYGLLRQWWRVLSLQLQCRERVRSHRACGYLCAWVPADQ